MDHISDDDLETYVMQTMTEIEVAGIDEQLLTCSPCGNRLRVMEEYVTAMREAAEMFRKLDNQQ